MEQWNSPDICTVRRERNQGSKQAYPDAFWVSDLALQFKAELLVCYQKQNSGSRHHYCFTVFMAVLVLDRIAYPLPCEAGLGHRTGCGPKRVVQIQWLANQEILSFCLLCSILVVHLFEKWCGIHQRLSCQPMENRVLEDCLNMQWMLREKDVIWRCVKLWLFRGSSLQCDLDSSNTDAGAKATCDLKNF